MKCRPRVLLFFQVYSVHGNDAYNKSKFTMKFLNTKQNKYKIVKPGNVRRSYKICNENIVWHAQY